MIECTNLSDGIFLIRSVVPQEHIDKILEYCINITEEEWNTTQASHYDETNFWSGRVYDSEDIDSEILESLSFINYRVSRLFKNFTKFDEFNELSRIFPADIGMEPHTDDCHEAHADVRYGLIMYLNDNFDGGEIYYPDLDIQHKPKSGDLVVHRGSILHGVKPVKNETRYMITAFVFGNEDAEFKFDRRNNE